MAGLIFPPSTHSPITGHTPQGMELYGLPSGMRSSACRQGASRRDRCGCGGCQGATRTEGVPAALRQQAAVPSSMSPQTPKGMLQDKNNAHKDWPAPMAEAFGLPLLMYPLYDPVNTPGTS